MADIFERIAEAMNRKAEEFPVAPDEKCCGPKFGEELSGPLLGLHRLFVELDQEPETTADPMVAAMLPHLRRAYLAALLQHAPGLDLLWAFVIVGRHLVAVSKSVCACEQVSGQP